MGRVGLFFISVLLPMDKKYRTKFVKVIVMDAEPQLSDIYHNYVLRIFYRNVSVRNDVSRFFFFFFYFLVHNE